MNVSVVILTGGDCPHRTAALQWVSDRYMAEHPGWELVYASGDTPAGYSRSQAIIAGAHLASGDLLVISDSDVWCDPAEALTRTVEHGWAVPHTLIHRLSRESTELVLAGADWRGLPLSTDNAQDSRPYKGNASGTLLTIRRDVLAEVPPDARFVGWGQEDEAWGDALRTLVGPPWRGERDLVHLWHPPQPRRSRTTGSSHSRALRRRYLNATRSPDRMRDLIEESRHGR